MDIGELDIHLRRRRHIDNAVGKQPRLPGTLRQLGAVGVVTRPGGPGSQQTFVKVLPVRSTGTRQHLAYLQYQKGQGQTHAPLYGPGARDPLAFARAAKQDPHQFRIIVSTKEDQVGDQRTVFIEQLVRQMERDLGRPLEWVAANHYDRPHAHTHIVLRGVANGEALYMAKSYFEHGIRDRADALLTRILGRRQHELQRYQVDQAYAQERLALNGMLRGASDPDLWRLVREQHTSQAQALAGQLGSSRQEHGADALRAELALMHQRMQALHQQQWQWHQAQRRDD
jgi:type IV secretory pathway VirD2 relaxase